ncbi:MAG: homoserine dehydrogenase, partial [Chloroflexi bacterium]
AVQGITQRTPADVAAAAAAGERWKLVATVGAQAAQVRPQRLALTHPLAAVGGITNAITFSTAMLGDVTLVGPGAGGVATGYALLADMLALHRAQATA